MAGFGDKRELLLLSSGTAVIIGAAAVYYLYQKSDSSQLDPSMSDSDMANNTTNDNNNVNRGGRRNYRRESSTPPSPQSNIHSPAKSSPLVAPVLTGGLNPRNINCKGDNSTGNNVSSPKQVVNPPNLKGQQPAAVTIVTGSSSSTAAKSSQNNQPAANCGKQNRQSQPLSEKDEQQLLLNNIMNEEDKEAKIAQKLSQKMESSSLKENGLGSSEEVSRVMNGGGDGHDDASKLAKVSPVSCLPHNHKTESGIQISNKNHNSTVASPLTNPDFYSEVTRLVLSCKTCGRLSGFDAPAARTSPKPFFWLDKSAKSWGAAGSDRSVLGRAEGSGDSGRGGSVNGVGCSMSPVDDNGATGPPPFYEFEIPQHIVGLIIGKKGVVIKDLTQKSNTFILIREHHWKPNYKICSIEGTREQINHCLRMIRRRFPPSRFPDLNLNPLLPPPMASPNSGMMSQMVQLELPEKVSCEVVVSAIVDAGHLFLQQPTHPSFTSLSKLDSYMLAVYSQPNANIPSLPTPVEIGVICAAPSLGGWYRAITVDCFEEPSNEVLVKFVDYGGYTRLPASDLKQIRSDFMALPFQASECYLAGVVPVDEEGWNNDAAGCVEDLLCSKVVEARVDSYAPDSIPRVHFTTNVTAPNGETVSTDLGLVLIEEGFAKALSNKDRSNHRR